MFEEDELKLVEPNYLYSLLNQFNFCSPLANEQYLLLLDCRSKAEYDECHIIFSKQMKWTKSCGYTPPFYSNTEAQENIVVYDSNTESLDNSSTALECALQLIEDGAKLPVNIVRGGYELFSKLYPFLRTQKIIWMPRELDNYHPYPLEIIPQFLYLGNCRHAHDKEVQKQLKIGAHINCSKEPNEIFNDPQYLYEVPINDAPDESIADYLSDACDFIENFKTREKNKSILVYSRRAVSRSVVVILAYLIGGPDKHTLETAWAFVNHICPYMRPNRAFVKQLSVFESKFHTEITNIDDPKY